MLPLEAETTSSYRAVVSPDHYVLIDLEATCSNDGSIEQLTQ